MSRNGSRVVEKRFRIRKTYTLPGLLVRVHQIPKLDPELEGADETCSLDDGGMCANIWIDKTLGIKRRRYLLLHALQHVMTDYLHEALDNRPHAVKN